MQPGNIRLGDDRSLFLPSCGWDCSGSGVGCVQAAGVNTARDTPVACNFSGLEAHNVEITEIRWFDLRKNTGKSLRILRKTARHSNGNGRYSLKSKLSWPTQWSATRAGGEQL